MFGIRVGSTMNLGIPFDFTGLYATNRTRTTYHVWTSYPRYSKYLSPDITEHSARMPSVLVTGQDGAEITSKTGDVVLMSCELS
jgi:hypothetical protein